MPMSHISHLRCEIANRGTTSSGNSLCIRAARVDSDSLPSRGGPKIVQMHHTQLGPSHFTRFPTPFPPREEQHRFCQNAHRPQSGNRWGGADREFR